MACQDTKPRDLRYGVTFYGKTVGASDGLGGFASEYGQVWAGRAKMSFGGLSDKVTGEYLGIAGAATMTVRKNAPVSQADRVEVQGRQYSVTGSDPIMPGSNFRKVYLRLWEHEEV